VDQRRVFGGQGGSSASSSLDPVTRKHAQSDEMRDPLLGRALPPIPGPQLTRSRQGTALLARVPFWSCTTSLANGARGSRIPLTPRVAATFSFSRMLHTI
jgi:hypothetical protein